MSSTENSKKIIGTWIKKGDSESNKFSKFICYWISFNCWLYTKTGECADRKALNKLYKNQSLYQKFTDLVKENEAVFKDFKNVCPIENNRNSGRIKELKNIYDFKENIDVIYEIRCNLFHGSKVDKDERDVEVIKASTPVLGLIVKNICKIDK